MKKTILILTILGITFKSHAQMGARIEQFYMDPSIIVPAAIGTDEKEAYRSITTRFLVRLLVRHNIHYSMFQCL